MSEGGRREECLCALWAICRSKRYAAFNCDEMCFNLVRGELSVGGDNDNFICITLFHKQSLHSARRGGGTDSRLDGCKDQ